MMTPLSPINSSSSPNPLTQTVVESGTSTSCQTLQESSSMSSPMKSLMTEFANLLEVDYPNICTQIKKIISQLKSHPQTGYSKVNEVREILDYFIISKLNRGEQVKSLKIDKDAFNLFLLRHGKDISTIDISGFLFPSTLMQLMPNLRVFKISGYNPHGLYPFKSHLEALGDLSHVVDVSLPNNGIEGNEMDWLVSAFRKTGGPIRLDLSGNRLAEDESEQILELCEVCPRLTSLNLSYNLFGNEGADVIAEYITLPKTLEEFFFAGNDLILDDEGFSAGVLAIASICSETPMLRLIDLSNNQLVLKDFESLIKFLRYPPHLQEIRLSLSRDETNLLIIPAQLKELKGLKTLSLSFDRIDSQETRSLIDAIKEQMPSLEVKVIENQTR